MCKLKLSRFLVAMLSIGLFVSLSGCSSDGEERPEYLDTMSVKGLEVPPKLSSPDTSGALTLPEPSAKAQKAFVGKKGSSSVIAPSFKGMALKNDSRLYWLEIDLPAKELWPVLPGFLAAEGIEVERVEKLMGFVDTRWMDEYQITYADEESGSSWFSGFSPDYKDKFRLRVEPVSKGQKSRLYVAHRGMQIVVTDDVSEWAQRETEPFLEREILYRFMLYSGASKHTATNLLAGYNSYQSRVLATKGDLSSFVVQGEKNSVWKRLNVAMDRLGVDIVKADKKKRRLKVLVGDLNTATKAEENNEGWFSGLFGRDIDLGEEDEDYQSSEYKKQKVAAEDKITINVSQHVVSGTSTIKLRIEDDRKIEDGLALDFRNALLKQLK